MAECKVSRGVTSYTLKMSEHEAIVLRQVVRSISGPHSGPRGLCDNIALALSEARVPVENQPTSERFASIHFTRATTIIP